MIMYTRRPTAPAAGRILAHEMKIRVARARAKWFAPATAVVFRGTRELDDGDDGTLG
jgi:hypothetical protein